MWKPPVTLVPTAVTLFAAVLLAVTMASAHSVAGATNPAKPLGPGKAPPPQAWTIGAENLEIGDADLKGAINPRGIPTVYYFQYGLTKSYGRLATGRSGTYGGNKRYAVEATAFELRPGATYHFRVVAVSRGGKTYGADMTFTSMKSRPKPGTVIACYHEKVRHYTALVRPGRCILRGYQGKKIFKFQITGMRWGHWGVRVTRAAYGVDPRDGERVRVIAFRRITCADGSTWYSRVVLFTFPEGNTFELRLPTCDDPSVIG